MFDSCGAQDAAQLRGIKAGTLAGLMCPLLRVACYLSSGQNPGYFVILPSYMGILVSQYMMDCQLGFERSSLAIHRPFLD